MSISSDFLLTTLRQRRNGWQRCISTQCMERVVKGQMEVTKRPDWSKETFTYWSKRENRTSYLQLKKET